MCLVQSIIKCIFPLNSPIIDYTQALIHCSKPSDHKSYSKVFPWIILQWPGSVSLLTKHTLVEWLLGARCCISSPRDRNTRPPYLPLRNLYAGQEATVRTGEGSTDRFQIGKGVHQGCMLSPCLFNLYAEYIMWNAGLDEAQTGIKISGRNINNLR